MQYISYEINGTPQYGVLYNGRVYPAGRDLLAFIQSGMKICFDELVNSEKRISLDISDVNVTAPIPRPIREIICLGKNYEDHAKEVVLTAFKGDTSIPVAPVYFAKSAFSVIGPNEPVPYNESISSQLDYETELAVIIGKECINISEEEAEDYIFGYTIINDITARDLQAKHGQWYLGKSLEGACPMGPVVADRHEISFPVRVNLTTRVNGEVRQKSNTEKLIFDIPYIISNLSRCLKLYPGDIIATGTPAGVGHGFNPPVNLKPGDVIECEIEHIGVLTNKVARV